LIDFNGDGKFDWFMAGGKNGDDFDFTPTIYFNDGSNNFSKAGRQILPEPTISAYVTLDNIYKDGKLALYHTKDYSSFYIQIIDLKTSASTTIALQEPKNDPWIALVDGYIVNLTELWKAVVKF
jgi:hypothetical protein